MSNDTFALVAKDLGLRTDQVQSVGQLLDAGLAVPFIVHYRKESTGGLDPWRLRDIEDGLRCQHALEDRRQKILAHLQEQERLTESLAETIAQADTMTRLEDLYVAYRPKKRTLAATAQARGLGPFAEAIEQGLPAETALNEAAKAYVDPEKKLTSESDVLAGAAHIIANRVYEDPDIRWFVRQTLWDDGVLCCIKGQRADVQAKEFKDYFGFETPLDRVSPQRVLAMNRGEARHALKVRLTVPEDELCRHVLERLKWHEHPQGEFIESCVRDCLRRLLLPFLEREVRGEIAERAERYLMRALLDRLHGWLMQAPVTGKTVLGVVPGYRTGCKLAVLSPSGELLEHQTVFPHQPQNQRDEAKQAIIGLVEKHDISMAALGEGTACHETEDLLAELIAQRFPDLAYALVNEAGASVYAASRLAKLELPDKDGQVRSAVCVGRRLLNPLVELTKIDPQHLVVGPYQHELHSHQTREALAAVAESCVHQVGADANTAGVSYLRHVVGLKVETARQLVEFRERNGGLRSRQQLRDVPGMTEEAFVQAAGFLRITGGDEPLDATRIHPESYEVCARLLDELGCSRDDLLTDEGRAKLAEAAKAVTVADVAARLGVGEPTLRDMLAELPNPGRDPRETMPGPALRKGPVRLEELQPGMPLRGVVRNVVDFGVFVDVGLYEDGLVHISRMADRFVSSPHDVVSVGDELDVWVVEVDSERQRVALTMISPDAPARPSRPTSEAKPRPKRKKPKKKPRPTKPDVKPAKSESTRLTYRPFADLGKLFGPIEDSPEDKTEP